MKFGAKTLLAAAVITPLLVGSMNIKSSFANPQRLKDRAEIILASTERQEIQVRQDRMNESRRIILLNALYDFVSDTNRNNISNLIHILKQANYKNSSPEFKKKLLLDLEQYGGQEFANYFHQVFQFWRLPNGNRMFNPLDAVEQCAEIVSHCGDLESSRCGIAKRLYSPAVIAGVLKLRESQGSLNRFLTCEEWQRTSVAIKQKFGISFKGPLVSALIETRDVKGFAERLKIDEESAKKILVHLDEQGVIHEEKHGLFSKQDKRLNQIFLWGSAGFGSLLLIGLGLLVYMGPEARKKLRQGIKEACWECDSSGELVISKLNSDQRRQLISKLNSDQRRQLYPFPNLYDVNDNYKHGPDHVSDHADHGGTTSTHIYINTVISPCPFCSGTKVKQKYWSPKHENPDVRFAFSVKQKLSDEDSNVRSASIEAYKDLIASRRPVTTFKIQN